MKLIGLIGGMSWQSTVDYYRIMNELVGERLGGQHSARLVLYSVDFDPVERAQVDGRWDDSAEPLKEAGRSLQRAGADFIVLCTNTMHKVADAVEEAAGLPLLHIADATAKAITTAGMKTVALLGTRFTMEQAFYRGRLADRFDIDVLIPEKEEDRAAVHRVIYTELCRGAILEESRQAYREVIERLARRGAEGVILGCTEIPLLIRPGDVDLSIFDTTRLHAEAAVELALADEPADGSAKWESASA